LFPEETFIFTTIAAEVPFLHHQEAITCTNTKWYTHWIQRTNLTLIFFALIYHQS